VASSGADLRAVKRGAAVAYIYPTRWSGAGDFGANLAVALTPTRDRSGVVNVTLAALAREVDRGRVARRNAWAVMPLTATFDAVADPPSVAIQSAAIEGRENDVLRLNVTELKLSDKVSPDRDLVIERWRGVAGNVVRIVLS
jgi:hypothetical protein